MASKSYMYTQDEGTIRWASTININCVLETGAEGEIAKKNENLFQCITTRTENSPLGPCSIPKVCTLNPGRGGRRKRSHGLRSISPLKTLNVRISSGRRRLHSSKKRLSWQSISSQGIEPSPGCQWRLLDLGIAHSRCGRTIAQYSGVKATDKK